MTNHTQGRPKMTKGEWDAQPEREYNLACPTVRKHHSFYWGTELGFEQMCIISDWIGQLQPHEKQFLQLLLDDVREDTLDQ